MPQKTSFNVALLQMPAAPDPGETLAQARREIAQAAQSGAELVCLPELFLHPYPCQREDPALFGVAEPIPGPTTDLLAATAREHAVVILVPLFERRAPGLYHNSVAVIDADGTLLGTYRKMHIPDDPGYYEKYYFAPGDLGFPVFDTRVGRIGLLICWDQWFPEAARLAALRGASILFYPTAIGWHPAERENEGAQQLDAWQTVQRGHAIANGLYVAAVNRVGHECPADGGPGITFWGHSFACDPQGILLAEAGADDPERLIVEVSLERLAEVRHGWPFLRDRRIDAYAPLSERYLDDTGIR